MEILFHPFGRFFPKYFCIFKTAKKSVQKRKACELCGKKFNKQSTFNRHMETQHRRQVPMEGQPLQENDEVQSRV